MITGLYNFARNINHKRKELLWQQNGKRLSCVRRIERVHPIKGKRIVAMTFDDGPCAKDFMGRGKGLTESILDILAEYGARATFDIIGTTEENYPDVAGELGSSAFGGVKFDHYPCFGEDLLAGAKNQPQLVRRMIDEGQELASHTWQHRIFGRKRMIYGKRVPLCSMEEVMQDLRTLHDYIKNEFSYEIRLARPPHYVDGVTGGGSAYDAYRMMGYQYLAASFDGDGWRPGSSYEDEVEKMLAPMRKRLAEDPDALSGQIIFQKDGCNMNMRTPVEDALPMQLKLLAEHGYQVVTVSELLELSPFLDLSPESPALPHVKELLARGHIVGYQNNTFHGERALTKREALLMLAAGSAVRAGGDLTAKAAAKYRIKSVTGNALLDLAASEGIEVDENEFKDKPEVCREAAVQLIAGLAQKYEVKDGVAE